MPDVPGLRGLPGLWTHREVTGITDIPRRLPVLGGGALGVEMAPAVHRLGSTVTVVHRGDRLLSREPRALGDQVAAALRADGAYGTQPGFLTLVSDGDRLTGAYAREAGNVPDKMST